MLTTGEKIKTYKEPLEREINHVEVYVAVSETLVRRIRSLIGL